MTFADDEQTHGQQWNGHFPQKVWCLVSIFIKDSQLYHIMNVFNRAVTKELKKNYLCSNTLNRIKQMSWIWFVFLHISYLQCKGFAPLRIEGLVDCVSLKLTVTKLNNT